MRKQRKVAQQKQRISYGAARRAYATYGERVRRKAGRVFETKVEHIGTYAEYMEWRKQLPRNVLKVVVLFEIEAAIDADQRMLMNAF